MDLLSKLLEKRTGNLKQLIELLVMLATFGTCLILTYSCYQFTLSEFKYGRESFLGIHSGSLVSISVIGFGLISIRTLFKSYLLFKELK
jgi:TRAP-type C4-dicarboxylate transport system permease small subunit